MTAPGWATSQPFLDDATISLAHLTDGFWGPTRGLYETFGWYRPLATLTWSFVYVSPDHLWVPRLLAVLFHATSCVCAVGLWRWVGGRAGGAAALVVVFGMAPYSLEAVGWPATLPSYALPVAMVLSGALVAATTVRSTRIAAGATVAACAVLAQEQVLPLTVLLLGGIALRRRRLGPVLAGAVIPVFVIFPASLVASIGANSRLSGPDGASVGNLRANADFALEYLRSTPLGDLWWSTQGVSGRHVAGGVLVGVVALLVVGSSPSRGAAPASPRGALGARGRLLLLAAAVLLTACGIAPFLLSGVPYISARFAYVPVLGLALALAVLLDAVPTGGRAGTGLPLLLLAPVALWSPVALLAEGSAYREQFAADRWQLASLGRAVALADVVEQGRVLVVAGFPGSSSDRPQFGEHINGFGEAAVRLLALREVGVPLRADRLDLRSGLPGLCLAPTGGFGLTQAWLARRPEVWQGSSDRADTAVFAVYRDGSWSVSEAGTSSRAAQELSAVGQLADCGDAPAGLN